MRFFRPKKIVENGSQDCWGIAMTGDWFADRERQKAELKKPMSLQTGYDSEPINPDRALAMGSMLNEK